MLSDGVSTLRFKKTEAREDKQTTRERTMSKRAKLQGKLEAVEDLLTTIENNDMSKDGIIALLKAAKKTTQIALAPKKRPKSTSTFRLSDIPVRQRREIYSRALDCAVPTKEECELDTDYLWYIISPRVQRYLDRTFPDRTSLAAWARYHNLVVPTGVGCQNKRTALEVISNQIAADAL